MMIALRAMLEALHTGSASQITAIVDTVQAQMGRWLVY